MPYGNVQVWYLVMSIVAYSPQLKHVQNTSVATCGCVLLCEMCDFFRVRVEPFVPGHVPLSRLCAGPYIPVASRNTDSQ